MSRAEKVVSSLEDRFICYYDAFITEEETLIEITCVNFIFFHLSPFFEQQKAVYIRTLKLDPLELVVYIIHVHSLFLCRCGGTLTLTAIVGTVVVFC